MRFLFKQGYRVVRKILAIALPIAWQIRVLRPLISKSLDIFQLIYFLAQYKRLPRRPPSRFNEFLFFLKTSPEIENPLRKRITDKEFSKSFINQVLGNTRTIETISISRTRSDINNLSFESFPVVLKPTHSSGRKIIVSNQEELNSARQTLKSWLSHDYFFSSFEKNYEGIEKKVIAEKYLEESFYLEGSVHCRQGKAKIVSLINRHSKERESFSTSKVPLGVSLAFPLKKLNFDNLDFFVDLISDSEKLGAHFTYIRVDFYTDGKNIIFGELTNLPAGGNGKFYPENGEDIFSEHFFS
jgi:hypothetical protein